MNIGELAKRTGLTNSRIRFYESAGLLKTVDRRPNGYRTYPPEAVMVLELITTAQAAGFSLDEIRKLLPPGLDRWDHGGLIEALRGKIADIEALESRLAYSKSQLVALLEDITAKPDDIDCAANARRVLSRVLGKDVEAPTLEADDTKLLGKTRRRRTISAR
ncbi:MerR family transcriptional regulator [Agrobacterium pusense]|jgi:DNA-binding transcriptional MerR regulator|uniref:MerR family transcriptional regulator n=1 Tax=Agrobacterium pusense TaxID=648995 RepID=UPI0024532302|nr:MerR family transcriptional regulator [Agrobacterium pusense]